LNHPPVESCRIGLSAIVTVMQAIYPVICVVYGCANENENGIATEISWIYGCYWCDLQCGGCQKESEIAWHCCYYYYWSDCLSWNSYRRH